MSTLHLTLNKHWFDMIAAGIKKEEYRQIKPYWHRRFLKRDEDGILPLYLDKSMLKEIDIVEARNGYSKSSPVIRWIHEGIRIGTPNREWCPPEFYGMNFFILQIGELLP